MEGLSESFAWFISGRQVLPEKFAHRFDRTGVGCFVAVPIGDIEHIGDLIHVGGDFRNVDQ